MVESFFSKLMKVFHFTEEGGKFVMSLKAFVSLSAIRQVHVYKFLSKPVHITYITPCLRKTISIHHLLAFLLILEFRLSLLTATNDC